MTNEEIITEAEAIAWRDTEIANLRAAAECVASTEDAMRVVADRQQSESLRFGAIRDEYNTRMQDFREREKVLGRLLSTQRQAAQRIEMLSSQPPLLSYITSELHRLRAERASSGGKGDVIDRIEALELQERRLRRQS